MCAVKFIDSRYPTSYSSFKSLHKAMIPRSMHEISTLSTRSRHCILIIHSYSFPFLSCTFISPTPPVFIHISATCSLLSYPFISTRSDPKIWFFCSTDAHDLNSSKQIQSYTSEHEIRSQRASEP